MILHLVLVNAEKQSKAQLCDELLKYWVDQCVAQFYRLKCLEVVLNYVGGAYIYIRALEMRLWKSVQLFGFSWPEPSWRSYPCKVVSMLEGSGFFWRAGEPQATRRLVDTTLCPLFTEKMCHF